MPRTLAQNAQYIAETIKPAIKSAIEAQGVTVPTTDSFLDYADRIAEIEGGGGGKEIDISKADYSIGSATNPKVNNGRILSGFANMNGYHSRPLDESGNWIDVDWSESFEIGVAFKFTAFPAYQGITGDGNNNSWRKAPRMDYDNSEGKIDLCISSDGSTLAIDAYLDYSLVINKWYFVKLKFVKSTMTLTVDITEDFIIYTNLYNNTMAAAPYHDAASLCFGGDAQQSNMTSNTFFIDTYNTYIKDDTGSIIWGAYAGAFDDGKYPIISGDYQLYDYIQSDGTQYINTGRKINAGDTFNYMYIPLGNMKEWGYLFGAVDNGATGLTFVTNSLKDRYDKGNQIDRTAWSADSLYQGSLSVSNAMNTDLYIFSCLPDIANSSSVKLYAFSINGDYYLPCKRKADGVFGLYDVANKAFLTDSANGNAFVGGNPIGNFDVLPKKDLDVFSIDIKVLDAVATGSRNGYHTETYTVDEDGFYFVGFSTWSGDGASTSITYSGDYTEFFSAVSSYVTRTSVAYCKAGTEITMYMYGRWMRTWCVYKIDGIFAIGDKLFENTSSSSMDLTSLSSDKVLACVYYTDSETGGDSVTLDLRTQEHTGPMDISHIRIWDGTNSNWGEQVGIIFFRTPAVSRIINNLTSFSSRVFQIFEIE